MENDLTRNPSPITEVKQSSFLVILLSILLIISCLIAGFFAYQTQKLVKELTVYRLQPTQTPTPSPTTDSTADWNVYTDLTNKFEVKYPNGWTTTKNTKNKSSYTQVADLAKTIDSAFYNPNGRHALWIKYIDNPKSLNLSQIIKSGMLDKNYGTLSTSFDDKNIKFIEANIGNYKVYYPDSYWPSAFGVKTAFILNPIDNSYVWLNIEPYDNNNLDLIFNQILSTFKFMEPETSSSPLPVACTMETKICPDGLAVGRSGPMCEFAPCPTTKSVTTSPQPQLLKI